MNHIALVCYHMVKGLQAGKSANVIQRDSDNQGQSVQCHCCAFYRINKSSVLHRANFTFKVHQHKECQTVSDFVMVLSWTGLNHRQPRNTWEEDKIKRDELRRREKKSPHTQQSSLNVAALYPGGGGRREKQHHRKNGRRKQKIRKRMEGRNKLPHVTTDATRTEREGMDGHTHSPLMLWCVCVTAVVRR